MVDVPTGAYRGCSSCRAPIVNPFPDNWTLELIKEGEQTGPVAAFYTPHLPDCTQPPADPRPGLAIRIRGNYVTGVRVDPPPVPAPDPWNRMVHTAMDPEIPVERGVTYAASPDWPGYLFHAPTGTGIASGGQTVQWIPLGATTPPDSGTDGDVTE